MQRKDFFAYNLLSDNFTFSHVPFFQIKKLIYNQTNLNQVQFSLSHGDGVIITKKVNMTSDLNLFNREIPMLNKTPKLSEEKLKDLRKLMPYMPDHDRQFYEGILEEADKENNTVKTASAKSIKKIKVEPSEIITTNRKSARPSKRKLEIDRPKKKSKKNV